MPSVADRGREVAAGDDRVGALDDPRLDALRRDLYRRNASTEDRRRYEDLRARLAAEVAVPHAAEPPSSVPAEEEPVGTLRPRLGALRTSVVVVGVLAVAATASVLSIPSPTGSAPLVPTATAPPARPHPDPSLATPVVVSVQGVARSAQRFHGVGPAVVPLLSPAEPAEDGRLVVSLASAEHAPLGWTAARWSSGDDGPSTVEVVARSGRRVRHALPRPESVVYTGEPPADIAVSDPGSHAWTLTVTILAPTTEPPR